MQHHFRVYSTHREKNVAGVHQTENGITDAMEVRDVRAHEESYGYDVMREHLLVVFSLRLEVEHQELVHPEAALHEVVELEGMKRDWHSRSHIRALFRLYDSPSLARLSGNADSRSSSVPS